MQRLQTRQARDEAQKQLQASLFCDRRASYWNVGAVGVAVLAPVAQGLLNDRSNLNTVVQYVLAFAIAFLLHNYSLWKSRGRTLRNEFEYLAYGFDKPYNGDVDAKDVDAWQAGFVSERRKQDTKVWFAECDSPDDELHQVRAAQLESLRFGTRTRLLWAGTMGSVCVLVLAAYIVIEKGQILRSSAVTLTTVAVIAIVSQIGRIAVSSVAHARQRTKLRNEILTYALAADIATGSTQALAIFQERINALRASRVIVPLFIYRIVSWWTSRK